MESREDLEMHEKDEHKKVLHSQPNKNIWINISNWLCRFVELE